MRNKTKAATPFRWMLRRYVFLAVLALVITFVVFPMQGIVRIISVSDFLKSPGTILDLEMRYAYMRELTYTFIYSPLNLETICALFGALGFLAAMVLFRHLFSRKQGMMYAALPMKRERDFGLRTGVFAGLQPASHGPVHGRAPPDDTGVRTGGSVRVLPVSAAGGRNAADQSVRIRAGGALRVAFRNHLVRGAGRNPPGGQRGAGGVLLD